MEDRMQTQFQIGDRVRAFGRDPGVVVAIHPRPCPQIVAARVGSETRRIVLPAKDLYHVRHPDRPNGKSLDGYYYADDLGAA